MKYELYKAGQPVAMPVTGYASGDSFKVGELCGMVVSDSEGGQTAVTIDGCHGFKKGGASFSIGDAIDLTDKGDAAAAGGAGDAIVMRDAAAGDTIVYAKLR